MSFLPVQNPLKVNCYETVVYSPDWLSKKDYAGENFIGWPYRELETAGETQFVRDS